MQIKRIVPCGYCKGVNDAIKHILKLATENKNENIYCINQIVHNDFVNKQLEKYNIKVLDGDKKQLLEKINSGIVVFSAHGTSKQLIEYALNKNLKVVNTICPWVKKVMDISEEYLKNNYDIIYIGKKNHPEAEAECSLSDKIHLIENKNDLLKLNINNSKIMITNQTTIPFTSLKEIYNLAKKLYPNIIMLDEICNATRVRQEAVYKACQDIDGLIVVGDKKSNNTKNLAFIGINQGVDTILVENKMQLSLSWLIGKKSVAIASGTSTPIELIIEIENYIQTIFNKK